MTFSELAKQLDGKLSGADVEFSRLSTDTRSIEQGDVYLALTGERFDGNDFVELARDKGAAGAIVSRSLELGFSTLGVADTHIALGDIAALNRQRSEACVIALTGSQGKTTVKEMLGSILLQREQTLITAANLNNTIGVPLTLLGLGAEHKYAVIEMGANRAGEIAYSARVCAPDIALITNANAAHLEGFGSLQGIVTAKGEILDSLDADGIAILNAEDANVAQWIKRAARARIVQFAFSARSKAASYYAESVVVGHRGQVAFELLTPVGKATIELQLLGKHNVVNAVAAAAAAIEAGASLDDVEAGLKILSPVKGRMNPLRGNNGSCLIDDTYNASPSSFFAAIDVLMMFAERKILVAGDMKELGPDAANSHVAVGEYARAAGVDELWAVGEFAAQTVAAFAGAGRLFASKDELIAACKELDAENVVILVKGSRGAGMEAVISELIADGDI